MTKKNEIKSRVSGKFHYKNENNPQVHVGKHEEKIELLREEK